MLYLLLGTFKGKSQDSISIRIKRCSRIILPFQNLINVKIKYSNTSDSINYLLYGVDIIETKKDTSQNYKDQRQGLSCAFTNRKGEFIYGFRQWISYYRLSKLESVSKKNRKFSKKQYKNREKDPLVLMPKQSIYRKYKINLKSEGIELGMNKLQILLICINQKKTKSQLEADEKQFNAITYSGICKTQINKFLFLNFASEYLQNIK